MERLLALESEKSRLRRQEELIGNDGYEFIVFMIMNAIERARINAKISIKLGVR
jgi:hypothetical protein